MEIPAKLLRREPKPSIHFGYLGEWGKNVDWFVAVLSPEENQQLENWYDGHKNNGDILCEMDAIGKLFHHKLKPISSEDYLELSRASDPRIDMSTREIKRLFDRYTIK